MRIIGLLGFIGSGKNTVGEYLVNEYGYKSHSFAASVKDATSAIFGWDREMLEGSTAESRIAREAVDEWWTKKLEWEVTPRKALQMMGTEAGRNVFGQSIWIDSTFKRIYNEKHEKVVITDTRFVNEIDAISKNGGEIYIIRRGSMPNWWHLAAERDHQSMAEIYPNVHISEWDWAHYCEHHANESQIIDNNGDLDELYNKIKMRIQP